MAAVSPAVEIAAIRAAHRADLVALRATLLEERAEAIAAAAAAPEGGSDGSASNDELRALRYRVTHLVRALSEADAQLAAVCTLALPSVRFALPTTTT